MENVITVNRTATQKVAANFVKVSMTVFGEAKQYADAIDEADDHASALCDAFKKLKKAGLTAGGINVTPVRSDKKIVGYRAVRAFRAEFDFDRTLLNSVLEILGGLNVEWHVAFDFKDGGENEKLLKRAVAEAKKSAQAIAEAAGVTLGELIHAEFTAGDGARPMMVRTMALDGGSAEPEQITLAQSVTCSWQIN